MLPGLLAPIEPTRPAGRHVEVAIDAAGGGGNRTYSYAVPPELADLADGEAVLVEFGRRQALGIVLGSIAEASFLAVRLARRVAGFDPLAVVRSDQVGQSQGVDRVLERLIAGVRCQAEVML